jgi:hypothetical protein
LYNKRNDQLIKVKNKIELTDIEIDNNAPKNLCAYLDLGFSMVCSRPTELQKKNTAMINESGGVGIILYPDGFEAFKDIVKGVMECRCHIPALTAISNAHGNTKCAIWKG